MSTNNIQHSPEPWKEHIDNDGGVWVVMPDDHSVYIGNMEGTCGVCRHSFLKVIAATPKLISHLRWAVELLEHVEEWAIQDFDHQRIDHYIMYEECISESGKILAEVSGATQE